MSHITMTKEQEEELLKSPVVALATGEKQTENSNAVGKEPKLDHKKIMRQYKAALSIERQLGKKAETDLTKKEAEDLAFAKAAITRGREHCSKFKDFSATDKSFVNKFEESELQKPIPKRQRSFESNSSIEHMPKKIRSLPKQTSWAEQTLASELANNHLVVYLIDLSHPYGHMTNENWEKVQQALTYKLLELLDSTECHLPSFDSFGWHRGVKIIKCGDDMSLNWCKAKVPELKDLWPNANLILGAKEDIPYVPNGKVIFPMKLQPDETLRLLQRQNPDVPTKDWKITRVIPNKPESRGQTLIIQINKDAEDLLYSRMGRMSWGLGIVFMKLKKRTNNNIQNDNTMDEAEIEKDLGLEALMAETENLNINTNADDGTDTASIETLSSKNVEVSSNKPTPQ